MKHCGIWKGCRDGVHAHGAGACNDDACLRAYWRGSLGGVVGFSADAIANRVADAAASGRKGGRSLPLKLMADAVIGKEICKGIGRKVLVFD